MLKTRKYDRMAEINQLEFAEELIVMEYMGDESYWNHKFSNRIEKLLPPEKLLLVQRIINNCYIKPMPLPLH